MKLIVGLGNPGSRYAGTRHNVGFDVIDVVAARRKIGMTTEKFHAWFGQGEIGSERVVLLKPTTFMNRSGDAVLAAGRFYQLEWTDLLVVADDLALPIGKLRMRAGGSSGLHKGLQDVIDRLGSEDWCRLRVGIGSRIGEGAHYVVGRFDSEEEAEMKTARQLAADAVECWVEQGVQRTMNRFN